MTRDDRKTEALTETPRYERERERERAKPPDRRQAAPKPANRKFANSINARLVAGGGGDDDDDDDVDEGGMSQKRKKEETRRKQKK